MAQNFFLKEPAPTKVQVVNENSEPLKVEIPNLPLASTGASLIINGSVSTAFVRPTSSTTFCVSLDNILLLQSDGTFVPISLNSVYTNLTNSNINNLLSSYKTAYATLVSGVTAATLHYSKLTNAGVVTSEVYDLKSVD